MAAIRAVLHETQIPSSSYSVPLDQPSLAENESRTNNLEPFECMYPSIPTIIWLGHITLQVLVLRRWYLVLTRINLWIYVDHLRV
jgi:hypothetical protein